MNTCLCIYCVRLTQNNKHARAPITFLVQAFSRMFRICSPRRQAQRGGNNFTGKRDIEWPRFEHQPKQTRTASELSIFDVQKQLDELQNVLASFVARTAACHGVERQGCNSSEQKMVCFERCKAMIVEVAFWESHTSQVQRKGQFLFSTLSLSAKGQKNNLSSFLSSTSSRKRKKNGSISSKQSLSRDQRQYTVIR